MDLSVCDFLEFFLYTLGVVVYVGKKEPTKPLCGSLLTPAHVPCLRCQSTLGTGQAASWGNGW